MNHIINSFFENIGSRIANYGYLLNNSSYSQVRLGRGSADIYRLLNKNWFPKSKIECVLDVGANEGQFIRTSIALMPGVPIYAFEPNPDAIQVLKNNDWGDTKVTYFQTALGSSRGTSTLYVSNFSPASSLLKNNDRLIQEFPFTATDKTIDVDVERLDTIIKNIDTPSQNFLLKIDVQGFELEVLQGSVEILDRVLVIVCEVSLAIFYQEQSTLAQIVDFLTRHGYSLVDIGQPIRAKDTEEILYFDLAFKKCSVR